MKGTTGMLKKVVIVFLLTLLGALAPAAAQDWTVSRVDESDGLSDNSVNDLLCDSRGLLWIGTNGGLDYYDGTNFVKVPFAGFGNSRRPIVFTLAEDPAGSIWTGTSEGLFCLEKDGGGMQPFLSPELDGASVRQMCCGGNGVLWIAVKDRNLTSSWTILRTTIGLQRYSWISTTIVLSPASTKASAKATRMVTNVSTS